MNITDLIVELLQQGQTVVLPEIGTFESVMQNAHHDPASGIYYPAHRTLAFSANAAGSDDNIVKVLAERECVSNDVAKQMWRNYVDALSDKMARTGRHAFGELGTLSGNGKEGYSFAVAEGLMLGNSEEQPIADVKVYNHANNDDPFAAFDDEPAATIETKPSPEPVAPAPEPAPEPEPEPVPAPEPTPEPTPEQPGENTDWNDELRKLEDMPKSKAELKAEEKAEKERLKAEKKAEEERQRMEKLAEEEQQKIAKRAAEVKAAAERKAEEDRRKAEKNEAKNLKKAEKEAEKERIKAEKEAAEQARHAEKEAAEQARRAEKEAAEQARRAEKEAKEQARRAEKEAKEQAKRNKKLADELLAVPAASEVMKTTEEKEEKKKGFPWWLLLLLLLLLAGAVCYYYYLSHPQSGSRVDNRHLKDVPAANSLTYNYDLIEYSDFEIAATRDFACRYLSDYINQYLAYRNYTGARVAMMDRVRQYAGQRLEELMSDRVAVQRFIPHNDYIYDYNEPFMKIHFADSMRYKVQGELLDMRMLDQMLDQMIDELGLQPDGDNRKSAAEVQQVKAQEKKSIEQRKAAASGEAPVCVYIEKDSKLGFDIIAGFYLNKSTAARLTARLHDLGCDAYIIEKNDMYYVSMGSAKDRTAAEALFKHIKGWYDGDIAIKQW